MTPPFRVAAAALCMIGSLLVVGCGDAGDAGAGPSVTGTRTESAPTVTETVPATTSTGVPTVPTSVEITAPTTPPPLACGIDINSADVNDALANLSAAFPGVGWVADRATDECNTLAWVQASVEGASGSSPNHVLFFVDGRFVGTATREPYAFSYVDSETDDTVTVVYRWLNEGDPTANPTGGPVYVRYQWDGTQVVALDPLPPEVTG